ncbi:MAG: hypothetical protein WCF90_03445 [Methanomicrobiales archaeon]
MWFKLLTSIRGIAFVFFHLGKKDHMGLLLNDAITGIIMRILLMLVSIFQTPSQITLVVGFLGVLGIFIVIILFCNHLHP